LFRISIFVFRICTLVGLVDQADQRCASVPVGARGPSYKLTYFRAGTNNCNPQTQPIMEPLFAILSPLEWSALRLSLQVALVAALFSLPLAVAAGYVLARFHFFGKWIVEILIDLPLVLPPVVTGYVLLVVFAPHGAIGSVLSKWLGIKIVFTWLGAALASAVVGFPLMVRAIRLAFLGVDPRLEMAARSLGASRLGAFFSVALPLARQGLIAGFMLAFARSLGEFGATIMVAGNIEGKTRTIPLAIYTLANTPDGIEATWRLIGLSVLLACAALAVSEWLQRRRPRDVRP
jgi:molybdate transport system permease protein